MVLPRLNLLPGSYPRPQLCCGDREASDGACRPARLKERKTFRLKAATEHQDIADGMKQVSSPCDRADRSERSFTKPMRTCRSDLLSRTAATDLKQPVASGGNRPVASVKSAEKSSTFCPPLFLLYDSRHCVEAREP